MIVTFPTDYLKPMKKTISPLLIIRKRQRRIFTKQLVNILNFAFSQFTNDGFCMSLLNETPCKTSSGVFERNNGR